MDKEQRSTDLWVATYCDVIREKYLKKESINCVIGTPDQRGDGYDIACAVHIDITDEMRDVLRDMGIPAIITKIYANGYFCGIHIIINADPNTMIVNAQHSGNWGPWYHLSVYKRNPETNKWRYSHSLGGHSKQANPAYPMGRP